MPSFLWAGPVTCPTLWNIHRDSGVVTDITCCEWLPSGKLTVRELENHHAINGEINYFDWAIFSSYVSHHQRVLQLAGFQDL